MSVEERESFLAGTHIGVLSVAGERAPLSVPIWYGYAPGAEIRISTPEGTQKLARIRESGYVGFAVQQEEMPYKYVSIDGVVVGEEPTDPEEYREWSLRYLGPERGERFFALVKDGLTGWVTIRVRPEKWRTYDFGKEFS